MIRAAVDWGSSSFRAWLFDHSGQVLDTISDAGGIKFIEGKEFQAALSDRIGHWLSPNDRVLLSGMITSRSGWIESEYLPCPVDLGNLLLHSKQLPSNNIDYIFLPGVSQSNPPDVMRGEELQMLGATASNSQHVFIIPGTHSKWASVSNRMIDFFKTIPTGELFDVILRHTLLGELTTEDESGDTEQETAFEQGVIHGFESNTLVSDLFTTRSAVLLELTTDTSARHWLSGLLIGNEISEGMSRMNAGGITPEIIGSASLCEKYLTAFRHLSLDVRLADINATVRGFQEIIRVEQG